MSALPVLGEGPVALLALAVVAVAVLPLHAAVAKLLPWKKRRYK